MRVVVVGATDNIGTSVLRSLEKEDSVESVLGLARRLPGLAMPKVEWAAADVVRDDLVPHFRGADAVVLLAWVIQPSRDLNKQWMVNVEGSTRVARAVQEAGVPSLVYASSVGAYSAGSKDRRVDESWPTGGVQSPYYGRHKAEVERRLDRFEQEAPEVRVVRMRPGLVFKKEAAEGIRRLFAGPFFPSVLANPALINIVPDIENLRSQVVHSYDVGEAFRLAIVNEDARGAFNLAAALAEDGRTFPYTRDTHRSRGEGAVKAVVWHGKEDVRVDNVPDPIIQEPTDAIIRITSTAICGSDLHLYAKLSPLM